MTDQIHELTILLRQSEERSEQHLANARKWRDRALTAETRLWEIAALPIGNTE